MLGRLFRLDACKTRIRQAEEGIRSRPRSRRLFLFFGILVDHLVVGIDGA